MDRYGREWELGKPYVPWQEGNAKSITFIVTEDCQLQCRYCYLTGKNSHTRMDFAVAKRTIDYLLSEVEVFPEPSVIWDFIGGEPLLEVELIDRICDYIKRTTYERNHPWFNSYRFSFSTNGLLYSDPRVQRFISKNRNHLNIGITIDGIKEKHDLQRVYPNGRGSYDDVIRNVPLWLQQFPRAGTKATLSRDDLPYLRDSVMHLWTLGIKDIYINVVFEDVWQEGDDELFEAQLTRLADDVIERGYYLDRNFTFFSNNIGRPLDPETENQNWCGAGKMLAVDAGGNFYPCVRFAPFSLQHRPPRVVGNCFEGVDQNKLRPFLTLDRITQSPLECVHCEVASGCSWCQGANYDFAGSDTIYQRATFSCLMHKARVRASNYYWNKLSTVQPVSTSSQPL